MIPKFRITGLSRAVNERVLSITVTDELGLKSDSAKVRFDNTDYIISAPPQGTIFDVYLGFDKTGLVLMGKYQLDTIRYSESQAALIEITGNAQYHVDNGLKAPHDKKWDEKTLGDIFGEIAGKNGYEPKIDGAISGIYYDHLDQNGESDIAFATRIAEKHDAAVKFQEGKMLVAPRNKTEGMVILKKGNKGWSIPGFVLEIPVGITATFHARNKYESVKAFWQDPDKARRTGEIAGTGSPMFDIQHTFASKGEAKSAAAAKLTQLSRGTSSLETIALPGNPHIRAGMKLILMKFHPDINGEWIIMSATHSFSNSGYSTSVKAEQAN